MSYLIEENLKKSRRKALAITIMVHVFILGGIWYSSLSSDSPLKTKMNEWKKSTGQQANDTEYNVRP